VVDRQFSPLRRQSGRIPYVPLRHVPEYLRKYIPLVSKFRLRTKNPAEAWIIGLERPPWLIVLRSKLRWKIPWCRIKFPDGEILQVFLVRGDTVRNSPGGLQFSGGAHPLAGPYKTPASEIWIEIVTGGRKEYLDLLLHEGSEYYDEKTKGHSYEKAHAEVANPTEQKARDQGV
jgi:hypothetical protein